MSARQSRLPFHPPFYYGWVILGMTMVSAFLAAGSSQLFMGIMLKPISEDLGWTRTMTAGAITAGTFVAGALSPLVGVLADRQGPRLLMPIGAAVVSLALLALAGLQALWQFYLAYVVARSVATVCLGNVVPLTTAANWFYQKRGRALGLVSMSLPLGGSLLALLGQYIITIASWRTVFVVFGVLVAVVVIGPSALLMRRRPEDVGLTPDGAAPDPPGNARPAEGAKAAPGEFSFTLAEALRTPTLWLLIASELVGITANGAVGFHQVAYYTDIGITAAAATAALSSYGLAGAFSSGLWGFLTERFSVRLLATGVAVLAAVASGLLLIVQNEATAIGISALYGLAARGEGPLLNMIIARYYGRDSFGVISGFATPFLMAGLGLGPLVGSLAFDLTGTYRGAFILFIFLYLLTAVFLFLAWPPRLPQRALTRRTPQEILPGGG